MSQYREANVNLEARARRKQLDERRMRFRRAIENHAEQRQLQAQLMEFPDLLSRFQGRTNGRQRAEYRRFLYRSIKTQLTQRQRQMMELRYFQGLSIPQIAQELRVNKSTVSRTINRALSRLRELADVYFDE